MRPKTSDQLNAMVEHIRYEATKILDFATVGNAWIYSVNGLPDGYAKLASESMLEAALIHMRNLVEFLQDSPHNKRVHASDYVHDWDLPVQQRLTGRDHGALHGRVAHLSVDRASVGSGGDFDWSEVLNRNAPLVLNGFRTFLLALTPEQRQLFNLPRPGLPFIDLVAAIDRRVPR